MVIMKRLLALLIFMPIAIAYSQEIQYNNFVPINTNVNKRLKSISFIEKKANIKKRQIFNYDKKNRVNKVITIQQHKKFTETVTYHSPKAYRINKFKKYVAAMAFKYTPIANEERFVGIKKITFDGLKKKKMKVNDYIYKVLPSVAGSKSNYQYDISKKMLLGVFSKNGRLKYSVSFKKDNHQYISAIFKQDEGEGFRPHGVDKYIWDKDKLIKVIRKGMKRKTVSKGKFTSIETHKEFTITISYQENIITITYINHFAKNLNFKETLEYDHERFLKRRLKESSKKIEEFNYTYEKGVGNAYLLIYKMPQASKFEWNELAFQHLIPDFPIIR